MFAVGVTGTDRGIDWKCRRWSKITRTAMSIHRGFGASPTIVGAPLRVIVPQLYAAANTIRIGLAGQGGCRRQPRCWGFRQASALRNRRRTRITRISLLMSADEIFGLNPRGVARGAIPHR